MPEDYERLRKRIEDGLDAVRELQKLAAEEDRRKRPQLRLIKGGLLVGALWAGVEWFRNYKRIAVALAATGITATGAVIAEQPHSPGADPPSQAIVQKPRPSVPPHSTPRPVVPTPPRRTSPPRIEPQVRARPPTESAAPTDRPTLPRVTTSPPRTQAPLKPTVRPPTKPPVKVPKVPIKTVPVKPSTPVVSLPVTPTVPPVVETPTDECVTITVLGICILG